MPNEAPAWTGVRTEAIVPAQRQAANTKNGICLRALRLVDRQHHRHAPLYLAQRGARGRGRTRQRLLPGARRKAPLGDLPQALPSRRRSRRSGTPGCITPSMCRRPRRATRRDPGNRRIVRTSPGPTRPTVRLARRSVRTRRSLRWITSRGSPNDATDGARCRAAQAGAALVGVRLRQEWPLRAGIRRPGVRLLGAKPGERILDLGCGDGALTAEIKALGADVARRRFERRTAWPWRA